MRRDADGSISAARTAIAEELRALLRRRHAHPPALRRAGRRLSQRRARFLDRHGSDQGDQAGAAAHVLGDVRVRTSSTRARSSRRWCARSAPSTRPLPARPRTSGACFPNVIRHAERPILRTAPAPLFALSDLVRGSGFKVVLTGEGADEVFAGYDIFKEAKVRRFCARAARARASARCCSSASIPICPACRASRRSISRRSSRPASTRRDDPLFSHLPRFRTTAGAKIFFSGDLRRTLRGYDAAGGPARRSCRATSRAGIRCRRRSISRPPSCCPATSCRRRATASRWRMRSKAASRSSITAWSSSPRASRRGSRSAGLREKHILRESMKDLLPATHRQARQAALPRAGQPVVRRRAARRTTSGAGSPPADIAAAGYFDPRAVEKLVEQVPQSTVHRLSRQHGLRRRALDAAMASRHSSRARRSLPTCPMPSREQ